MKKLIFLLVLISTFASAQTQYGPIRYIDQGNTWQYGRQVMQRTDHANLDTLTSVLTGSVAFDTLNAVLVYFDGVSWVDVGSGSGGGSEWTRNGSIIRPNNASDSVSIGGTTPPVAKFEVHGNTHIYDADTTTAIIIDTSSTLFGTAFTGFVVFTDSTVVANGVAVVDNDTWGTISYVAEDTAETATFQGAEQIGITSSINGLINPFYSQDNDISLEPEGIGIRSNWGAINEFSTAEIMFRGDTMQATVTLQADSIRVNSERFGVYELLSNVPAFIVDVANNEVNVSKSFKLGKFTAIEASTTAYYDGTQIYVTSTDATFNQIGIWGLVNGSWIRLH